LKVYSRANGAILPYDISALQTFQSLSRWLHELYSKAELNIVVMIVGNKCDLEELRAVSTEDGLEIAKCHHFLFMEMSALDGTNVTDGFTQLTAKVVR
jgi:Ras-related protein Rab-11A